MTQLVFGEDNLDLLLLPKSVTFYMGYSSVNMKLSDFRKLVMT